jgi:multidrug efflux pump subunit AcrA (membrane-fusion protein)
MVNVGDGVQRGQLLATFAPESVQADVALARASLAEAQANALDASANAERARAVQGSGALSAQQVNQYLTQELTAPRSRRVRQGAARRPVAAAEAHPGAGTRCRHRLGAQRHRGRGAGRRAWKCFA